VNESYYMSLLRDPRWQKKRLKIMDRDKWNCIRCGDKSSTLNVHHEYYQRGLKPWDYPDSALITLCEPCHQSEHGHKVKKNSYHYTETAKRYW
jgi:5-methylcytosine-specific restriction endonuclease McrA